METVRSYSSMLSFNVRGRHWNGFCDSIILMGIEMGTDHDIREYIRRRKQKVDERFDEFYDAIVVMYSYAVRIV